MFDLKKRVLALLLLLVTVFSAVTFTACKKDPVSGNNADRKYTVSFYNDAGEFLESREFTYGVAIEYPELKKEGYYTRWDYFGTDGNELNYSGSVYDDMKVVARYEKIDCLVSVYDGVTDEKLYEKYYSYGDTYTPEIETSKAGYIFLGFKAQDADSYSESFTLTDSVNIYAVYEAIPYTITFMDDTTSKIIYDASTAYYGTIALPSAPKKDGFTFDGWYVVTGVTSVRVGGEGDKYQLTESTDFWAVYKAESSD